MTSCTTRRHGPAAGPDRERVGAAIEELHRFENELAAALLNLSDLHEVDHEIFFVARDIAGWWTSSCRRDAVHGQRPSWVADPISVWVWWRRRDARGRTDQRSAGSACTAV